MIDVFKATFTRIDFKLRNLAKSFPILISVFRDDENEYFKFVITYDSERFKGGD